MKKTGFIIFFTMLFLTKAFAQNNIASILSKSYGHTISYAWGKAVFFLLTTEKSPSYTDHEKRYFWYSGNVINNTQGGFSGRLLDGDYREYYSNKNLKVQGAFKVGLKVGKWNTWTEEGTLISSMSFKSGIVEGEFKEYDSLGKISRIGKYKDGLLTGKISRYTADSVTVEKYDKGKIVSPKRSWVKKRLNKIFFNNKKQFNDDKNK